MAVVQAPQSPERGAPSAVAEPRDSAGDGDCADADDESRLMAEMMGFSAFDTTQGKEVDDPRCKLEAVKKKAPRKRDRPRATVTPRTPP